MCWYHLRPRHVVGLGSVLLARSLSRVPVCNAGGDACAGDFGRRSRCAALHHLPQCSAAAVRPQNSNRRVLRLWMLTVFVS